MEYTTKKYKVIVFENGHVLLAANSNGNCFVKIGNEIFEYTRDEMIYIYDFHTD